MKSKGIIGFVYEAFDLDKWTALQRKKKSRAISGDQITYVRIPKSVRDEIERLAKDKDRPFSDQIRHMLRNQLKYDERTLETLRRLKAEKPKPPKA